MEQVNELLKGKLAVLIAREIPMENGLITITDVDCSPDFKNLKVGISVLPFNQSKKTLDILKRHGSFFSNILRKETRLRKIPKFNWVIDKTEEKASGLEKIFKEIEGEEEEKEK